MNINEFPDIINTIFGSVMSDRSIYKANQKYLEEKFAEYKIDSKTATELLAKTNSEMTISITAVCVNATVELLKTQIQAGLAQGEKEFNAARTALVQAQTATEAKKAGLVDREKASFDDNLRIKEAENLANVVSMYAAGGMAIPGELQTSMLDAVNRITK
ncbi:hypothetical protein [Campylobacter sp.]|uniref:hypothetical protein n=1 Tax=Campylobacter sp. TaxID=205 RepID=UPI001B6FFA7E|nr:hypothetical protein [Campylobacter sp.]MBP3676500.1 hypothetical protein [Campylobacter sp.]MBQ7135379.1 hypothetical protein [Campylobacter sp.]